MTHHAAKAKTCTEDGNSEYWSCSVCGLYFSDVEGKNAIEKDSWIDKARGHIWGEWEQTKDPGEYETGLRVCQCTNCTETQEEIIPALGHTHVLEKTDAKARTCTEDGNTAYWTCKGCGLYFSDAEGKDQIQEGSWTINAGHVLEHYEAQAPTCTKEGWEAYDACKNCSYSTKVMIHAFQDILKDSTKEDAPRFMQG